MFTDFEESTIGTVEVRDVRWQYDDVKGSLHPSNSGNTVCTSVIKVKNRHSR